MAARTLPLPALPWDPQAMSLDQIRMAYGLMPRGVIALLAGAMLGLSGAILQVVLRNPVADPTTLGISAGAQLALVLATILSPTLLEGGPLARRHGGRGCRGGAGAGHRRAARLSAGDDGHRGHAGRADRQCGLGAVTLAQGQYLLSLVIWNGGSLVQQDWSGVSPRWPGCWPWVALAAAMLARPLRLLSLGGRGRAGPGPERCRDAAGGGGRRGRAGRGRAAELADRLCRVAAPAMARSLGVRTIPGLLAWSPVLGALILSICDGLVLALAGLGAEKMFPTGALTGLVGGPLLIWLLPRLRGTTPPGAESGRPPCPAAGPSGAAAGGNGGGPGPGGAGPVCGSGGCRGLGGAGPREPGGVSAHAPAPPAGGGGVGGGAGAGRGDPAAA